jgi:hypothetical protein
LHAKNFSEAIHGASLLYNLMLAEKMGILGGDLHEGMVSHYEDELTKWADYLQSRIDDLGRWDYRGRFREILSETGGKSDGADIAVHH